MPEPTMSPFLRPLPAHEYRRERWRNGHGWTREVLRMPEAAEDWDWRLSIAEIERDAPFSAFPGVERELVLLRGAGVRLRFDDGEVREVVPPHGRVRFAGERSLAGELIDGPTHDLNLMWRRDRIEAEAWHRPLVGSMVLFVEPGEYWLLHLLTGHAHCVGADGDARIDMGDSLLLSTDGMRRRFAIDGGGEALIARLRPRAEM